MKYMKRLNEDELAMVVGGAPQINAFGMEIGRKDRKQTDDRRTKDTLNWNWGDDWGDEGYWRWIAAKVRVAKQNTE